MGANGGGIAFAPKPSIFSAPNMKIDPAVASLFNSSAGPTQILPRPPVKSSRRHESTSWDNGAEVVVAAKTDTTAADELLTSSVKENNAKESRKVSADTSRPRKKRKISKDDDIETSYLNRLMQQEVTEQEHKSISRHPFDTVDREQVAEPEHEDAGDDDDEEQEVEFVPPQHESLVKNAAEPTGDELQRTIFLSNVSVEAIRSKSAKKTLIKHLQTAFVEPDDDKSAKINTIRFRSTAYVSDAGPKRAAYAKKQLMDDTTKNTNAYVVLSTPTAAKAVAAKLNGTVVLERHLRVDYLGKPAEIDHKRCIFVGNLSFVDLESADAAGEDGRTEKRPKGKTPADVEEGLWRTFGKVGNVENVRVVRDKETRISKGFAYVQFMDENSVEAALLLDGKKYPPHLPRTLRVMRAKKPGRPDKARGSKTHSGDRGKSSGVKSQANAKHKEASSRRSGSSNFVFEGQRATAQGGGASKGKKRHAVKPTDRSARRAAAFKAGGRKRKSEA